MPILDLQKRSRELGRIRLGQKGDKGQPQKLDRFRFTTNSQALLEKVAVLYGGQPRPWEGGTQGFELISDSTRVPIMVPPQPVTQWFEFWTRAGCQHRCDGYTNALADEPCQPDDPKHLEALKKPTTRLNVVLRDIEGIGVWRVETHGWNAAVELPDVAEFLAQAGGYVNGWLSLEQRTSIDNSGEKPVTRQFMVPIIEIDVTPSQLMAGHGRVAAPPMIGGPTGQTPALVAAGPDYVALAADVETADEVRAIWLQANGAGHMTQGLSDHLQKRAEELKAGTGVGGTGAVSGGGTGEGGTDPTSEPSSSTDDTVVDAELVDDDADAIWAEILRVAGERGMLTGDVEDGYAQWSNGLMSSDATAAELRGYLTHLQARAA